MDVRVGVWKCGKCGSVVREGVEIVRCRGRVEEGKMERSAANVEEVCEGAKVWWKCAKCGSVPSVEV